MFRDGHWQFETAGLEWRSIHHVAGGYFDAIGEALHAPERAAFENFDDRPANYSLFVREVGAHNSTHAQSGHAGTGRARRNPDDSAESNRSTGR